MTSLSQHKKEWDRNFHEIIKGFYKVGGNNFENFNGDIDLNLLHSYISQRENALLEEVVKTCKEMKVEWEKELEICREWVKKSKESMDWNRRMFRSEVPDDGELWASTEQLNISHGNLQALSSLITKLKDEIKNV